MKIKRYIEIYRPYDIEKQTSYQQMDSISKEFGDESIYHFSERRMLGGYLIGFHFAVLR